MFRLEYIGVFWYCFIGLKLVINTFFFGLCILYRQKMLTRIFLFKSIMCMLYTYLKYCAIRCNIGIMYEVKLKKKF